MGVMICHAIFTLGLSQKIPALQGEENGKKR